MHIEIIHTDKRQFLPLLLLGDEDISMIDRYLDRGALFALYDDNIRAICVLTDEGDGIYELKNIATDPTCQNRGYATALIRHIQEYCRGRCHRLILGTGDVPRILSFYEKRGFTLSHRLTNFFIDHYEHPIIEDGVQLVDMVYLKMDILP